MTIQLKHLTLILGGILLAIGITLGLTPVKASGTSCGTAFTGTSRDARVSDMTNAFLGRLTNHAAECDDAISSRRAPALALTIPGLIGMLAGVGLAMTETGKGANRWQPEKSSSSPTTSTAPKAQTQSNSPSTGRATR